MSSRESTPLVAAERQTNNAEQYGEIAHERNEAIKTSLERAARERTDKKVSEREIISKARELATPIDRDAKPSRSEKRQGAITKQQLNTSFKAQMKQIKSDMRTDEKIISSIIHFKPIEKTSDILGKTLLRPNAMLSGSITAFLGITILYLIARHYGFQLSGFETLGAFILGWVLGVLYDYASVMFKKNK